MKTCCMVLLFSWVLQIQYLDVGIGRLKTVKYQVEEIFSIKSNLTNKLAEVHGNRTHLGRF
ncbi:MAG: hypothetical protein CVU71_11650 [Deltaproteobacteria bacterium HGW-Deltaproteobacteria-6]|nr:MAG: hypothetical protein CVU71_11650 [Deltaproteobacteria bacterium HGW-Deltaproteobacteria-6]